MKPQADLWPQILAWPNLLLAAHKARLGKRDRPVVQRFHFHREWLLLRLQRELADGSYRPGEFTSFRITRPKPRLISAAPFRDRVVHHAILNVVEPVFERRFFPHSYACRKGKGTHAAVRYLQRKLGENRWLLPCDVCQFFPSIDHEILKGQYRRLFGDAELLEVLDRIVASWRTPDRGGAAVGLPIGNLTSQWLANLYLDPLDHFLTSRKRVGGYVRYCDDFVLLDNDREKLEYLRDETHRFLAGLRLLMHEDRAQIRPRRCGVTYLGYRVWSTHVFLPREKIRKQQRRIQWMQRAYANYEIDAATVRQRVQSWLGHAQQADSKTLIPRLLNQWRFRRKRRRPPGTTATT